MKLPTHSPDGWKIRYCRKCKDHPVYEQRVLDRSTLCAGCLVEIQRSSHMIAKRWLRKVLAYGHR